MSKYAVALFLLLSSCSQGPLTEIQRWEARAREVTIIRDDFGVPHIYGKTDADAVFGLLYAQCEDDFNRVEQNYIWATGRLAEVEGEGALFSDLRANLFMTQEEAMAAYENSPPWLKELCDAFADGINYYLYTHPEVKPRLLDRFEPWMPMYFSEGSIGGDIERVSVRGIEQFYKSGMEVPELEALRPEEEPAIVEPQGSNGIAISGELTESGHPLLLINPHTSFFFRGEVHMVSEQGLNAYGAVTWGQFFIYQGFNEKTGWMHTSSYADVMDEFKETLVRDQGQLYYWYGEGLREVDSLEVRLKFKADGVMKERTFPIYRTHHGPITQIVDGQWTATAMMWEPAKALEQSFMRTKQQDYEGFRSVMDLRTNSSNNTVYADAQGNIAYFHGNFIPKRDTIFDYTRPVDGSDPRTDWQGLHTVAENILLLNPENGWIQNCNSTPYSAASDHSPKRGDYPKYMSRDQENFRGLHAISLLEGTNGHTLERLIELAHDPYLPAFEALIPGLVRAFDQDPRPALAEAIALLRAWDYTTSKESVAMTLAHYYGNQCYAEADRPEGLYSMQWVEYWGSAWPDRQKLDLLEASLAQLEEDFGTWKMPWGEVNRYQRLDGEIRQAFDDDRPSIPIGYASGTWGALAAYGANYHNNTKKIYGTRGNSFIAVVEFGKRVRAKTLLAGGQSGDPESPHFDDQAKRYADTEFKEAAYYREDVLKRATRTYRPGE